MSWFLAKKIKASRWRFQGKEGNDEEIIKMLRTIEIKSSKKIEKLDIDCLRYDKKRILKYLLVGFHSGN